MIINTSLGTCMYIPEKFCAMHSNIADPLNLFTFKLVYTYKIPAYIHMHTNTTSASNFESLHFFVKKQIHKFLSKYFRNYISPSSN